MDTPKATPPRRAALEKDPTQARLLCRHPPSPVHNWQTRYWIHLDLPFLSFFFFFFFSRATDQQNGIRTKKSYLKTTRSCMDTPMNMYSSKGHIKRLTGAFFLADIQTMTYTQVHRYLGHASMFLLTLHQTMSHSTVWLNQQISHN